MINEIVGEKMYCKECGKEIPDDAKYCSICGTPVKLDNAERSRRSTTPPSSEGINRHNIKAYLILIAISVLAVAVAAKISDIQRDIQRKQVDYQYVALSIDYAKNHPGWLPDTVDEAEEWLRKTQDELFDGATKKQRQEIESFVDEYYENNQDGFR